MRGSIPHVSLTDFYKMAKLQSTGTSLWIQGKPIPVVRTHSKIAWHHSNNTDSLPANQ